MRSTTLWLLVIAENKEGVGEGEGRGQGGGGGGGGGGEVHDGEYHYEMTDLPTTPTMMLLHMMITSMIHEFSISHQVVYTCMKKCDHTKHT